MNQNENGKSNKLAEQNGSEIFDLNQVVLETGGDKKISEVNKIKKFLFSHKRYVLTLFPVMFAAIFLGSICSSLQKKGYMLLFTINMVGFILMLALSIFLTRMVRKKLQENNLPLNFFLYIIFVYMFVSGFILMLLFKILSMVNSSNMLNLTGLISVIVTLVYFLLLITGLFVDFKNIKHFFNRDN